MTLRIPISPEAESRLRERAAAAGVDVETFVQELVEKSLKSESSLADILAPLHAESAASGLTDDDQSAILDEALSDARRGNRGV